LRQKVLGGHDGGARPFNHAEDVMGLLASPALRPKTAAMLALHGLN
jgi:hypothetical protein